MQANLVDVLNASPELWKHPEDFLKRLIEIYPQDEKRRELIMCCIGEHIPEDLYSKNMITSADRNACCTKLKQVSGCNGTDAIDIINMWIEAKGITVIPEELEDEFHTNGPIDPSMRKYYKC